MCDLYCYKCGSMHHSTQNCDAQDEKEKVGYRTTKLVVCKDGAKIFAEGNFEVEICDEAAGEFLTVRELTDDEPEIRINTGEWPALREAIDLMIGEIR